jgi:hypothetical protein
VCATHVLHGSRDKNSNNNNNNATTNNNTKTTYTNNSTPELFGDETSAALLR